MHPDTLISTDKGKVKIKDLKKGDKVLTLNENSKEKELKEIQKVHKNLGVSKNEKMFLIKTENGQELKITGNHKVLTKEGWKR